MNVSSFDVIIIGGGINGAGIARDAAERGLKVYLAEKNDFAFGTTFRSTKLIHGGLRYLEQYEIGLVRESLREREILLKQAPHLIRPIKFAIPIYEDNKYGYGKVKLGLLAYDILSYDKSLENHSSLSADELLEIEPFLRQSNLKGGFLYFDCQVTYPERLCLENILLATMAGATVQNYAEVTSLLRSGERVVGVRVKDLLNGREMELHGEQIINASGPWVDEILRLAEPEMAAKMGGTKGSHILIPKFYGGPQQAVYLPAHQDGRPFFIVPWRDYYWVGTTDIRYTGELDAVQASKSEVAYLLREVNFIFPESGINTSDVLYCLAGIRPLPVTDDETEEAEITRRHLVYDHEPEGVTGLLSIIGGKLTTYRQLAEETVDAVFEKRGESPPECQTAQRPLWGGGMRNIRRYTHDHSRKYSKIYRLAEEQVAYLISIYGSRFRQVLALIDEDATLREPLCKQNPDIKAQLLFSLRHERPRTLADIYIRRTGLGSSACRGIDCCQEGAKIMGRILGWSRRRVKAEIDDYEKRLSLLFGCTPT